ncbi:MAG: FAD-dependent oxidoreductase [Spirochaetia bacterium]|jgi:NADPH-dependent 2,4-dienoyl-CoA reductase/sulfur reductase-like enzyme|nr:FAD-dependent oxidoreductase [Spirochaetia bacterium]
MKELKFDTLVIGGGSAGMAAALEVSKRGFSVAVVERENSMGGILNQCIHNGFGLHHFNEELSGPAYAEKFIDMVESSNIKVFLDMTVMDMEETGDMKYVYGMSGKTGMIKFCVKTVIFANGCRERNRGSIGTPGTRPSGVFTAGLAQRLVNMEGYIPGKECVIVGSGDIGLIMARRMTWVGAKVKAVIEIQPYPAGLTRNIVQCLNDFNIPLYLSHVVGDIHGKDRVESIDVIPLKNGVEQKDKSFNIICDSLLLAVGLVPDNELAQKIGISINPETNGPIVDRQLMTGKNGIFACGNVLHVHDLVDFVTEESERCGKYAADYMDGKTFSDQYRTVPGQNIKYLVPNFYSPHRDNKFYLRTMIVKNRAELIVSVNGKEIFSKKLKHIQPSEMISFSILEDTVGAEIISECRNNTLEVKIV